MNRPLGERFEICSVLINQNFLLNVLKNGFTGIIKLSNFILRLGKSVFTVIIG